MDDQKIPDQFSKSELAKKLRESVDNLSRLSDEIIITYLQDDKDNKKSGH